MPPLRSSSTIVEAIDTFFAEHEVASLRLPSGWFGRPHDNMHQLSEVAIVGDYVLVTLDEKQVLTLDAGRVRQRRTASCASGSAGGAGTGPSTAARSNIAKR